MKTTLLTPAQIHTIVSQAINLETELMRMTNVTSSINHELNLALARQLNNKFETARKDAETVMNDYYNVYGWRNIKAAFEAGEIN